MSAATVSSCSAVREASTTSAPASASPRAVAAPMPRPAPVTIAILSSTRKRSSTPSPLCGDGGTVVRRPTVRWWLTAPAHGRRCPTAHGRATVGGHTHAGGIARGSGWSSAPRSGSVVAAAVTATAGAAGIIVKPSSNLVVGQGSYSVAVTAPKGTFGKVPSATATPVARTVTTKAGSAAIVGRRRNLLGGRHRQLRGRRSGGPAPRRRRGHGAHAARPAVPPAGARRPSKA